MTVTFVSNYINHHQIPLSNACYEALGNEYHFIQTEPMEAERVEMGWSVETAQLPYLCLFYEKEEVCRRLITESDVVIFGWTKREDLAEERLQQGKTTLRVSERIYREGQWKFLSPRGLLRKYKEHTRYRKKQVCLLCAGAYVASDFRLVWAYPGKMFRFGYFPETAVYEDGELKRLKESGGTVHMVWAGRFLPLKHPEFAVRLAQELQRDGRDFHIHMAGSGELEDDIRRMVKEKGLSEFFTFYGYTEPEKVRRIMEKCSIHLFTSNYLEGWGAVVNEAMNSGCAVVANVEAGAVPFLIKHEENGLVYRKGSYEDFAAQVKRLLERPQWAQELGEAACHTIADLWNAEHAAAELLRFCGELLGGRLAPAGDGGPMSPAPVVAPGRMYGRMVRKEKSLEG